MSYWGRASSPAWAASSGPSPVVPLLIVVALGWVICNETLSEWYEQVTEVQETVTDNAVLLLLGAGLLVLAAVFGNRGEVVLVPVALALVIFLLQNIMVTVLLLLVAAYFAVIYYYRPDRGYDYGIVGGGGDWGGAGVGGSGRLGFYMLLVLCLVLCAMFSEDGGSWWIPGVLLVGCLLCLNLFSGGKVWGYEYF